MNKKLFALFIFLFLTTTSAYALTKEDYRSTRSKLESEIHRHMVTNLTIKERAAFGEDLMNNAFFGVLSRAAAHIILNQPGITFPLTRTQINDLARFGVSKGIEWEKMNEFSKPVFISKQMMKDKEKSDDISEAEYYVWVKIETPEEYIYPMSVICRSTPSLGWPVFYSKNKDATNWLAQVGIYNTETEGGSIQEKIAKKVCANKSKAQLWPYHHFNYDR